MIEDIRRTLKNVVKRTKIPFVWRWPRKYTQEAVEQSSQGDETVYQKDGAIISNL